MNGVISLRRISCRLIPRIAFFSVVPMMREKKVAWSTAAYGPSDKAYNNVKRFKGHFLTFQGCRFPSFGLSVLSWTYLLKLGKQASGGAKAFHLLCDGIQKGQKGFLECSHPVIEQFFTHCIHINPEIFKAVQNRAGI